MPIRDLGYKAYDGTRLPASRNTWVLLRHGVARAWGSWVIKLTVFISWLWVGGLALGKLLFGSFAFEAAHARTLITTEFLMMVIPITLGAGAGVIAHDLSLKSFQFYFAKPVTPPQYLMGRIGAVVLWCLMLTVPWALLYIGGMTGAASLGEVEQGQQWEQAGLMLPAIGSLLMVAVVMGVVSVGISSISKSRAATTSAWLLLLLVPWALGAMVGAIAEWPWLKLASIPTLMGVVSDALFKIEPGDAIRWYHAAPILLAVCAGSLYLAYYRLQRAEVIT
jgi:hypothetical protein